MKHNLLNKLLSLTLLIMGGAFLNPAWGETYSLTPNQTATGSTATSYITTLTEFTYNEISWKMNQWNPSTLQIRTNQSSAANEFRFYNTSAIPGRITQVVITFSALTVSDASKLMFLGGTSEVTATTGGTAGTWNSSKKTLTWTPGESDDFTYFAFYQDGKAASGTNYLASSDAIVVTYTLPSPTHILTYSASNGSISGVDAEENGITSGDDIAEGATVTLTATPSDGYEFSSWEVSGSGSTLSNTSTNTTTFTMGTEDATVTANFVVAAAVSSPTFSPASGTAVYYGTKVTAESATDGAVLYYTKTTDGSEPADPTDASTPYPDGGITIDANTVKIKMIAKKGSDYSNVALATYTLQEPAVPTFSVAAGAVARGTNVTISSAAGTTIYYTTDGSDADKGTDAESNTVNVTIDAPKTIKAIAVDPGLNMSTEVSAIYTIAQVATPSFSPAEGAVTKGSTVSLSCATEGATIHYTRDGSTPTLSSPIYSSAITINFSQTIKAIAVKDNYNDSEVASATYTISGGSETLDLTTLSEGDTPTDINGTDVKYTFSKGTGSNDPKFYSKGNALRFYQNNTLTIASTTKTISSIAITYTQDASNMKLVDGQPGSFGGEDNDVRTWTGSASSVQFTASAACRFTTITVTYAASDTRTACVTSLGLATKSFAKDDIGTLTTSGTEDGGLTEDLVYTFSSDNDDVFEVLEDGTYKAKAIGTAIVTVTASPSEADIDDFKAVTEEVEIAVTTTNTLAIDKISASTTYGGSNITITATPAESYNGTLTAVSSNEDIATVSVDGNIITVSPNTTVGKATITITAPTTSVFIGSNVSRTCEVTVNQPAGSTESAPSTVAVFTETFANCTGTSGWSGSVANGELKYDNSGWTSTGGYGNGGSAKYGGNSTQGHAITPALGQTGDFTLSFKSGAWSGDKTTGGLVLSIVAGTGTLSQTTFDLKDSEWADYEVTLTGASTETKIKFSAAQASKNRFFLDDIVISKPAPAITKTLNSFGYATFCSEYPLNFTGYATADYSAWEITKISESEGVYTLTFNQLTGTIKGGQGILLKGTPNATVTLTSANSSTELNDNKLEGTLAPTYVEAGEYYGLFGQNFVRVAASTVDAHKALLPASALGGGSVKAFNFVFEDNATGIRTVETVSPEEAAQIFDLSGRRLNKIQKGINIVNGKKVLY